jgi:predicted heme/steroid binding protein
MKRLIILAVLLVLIIALLSGCGSQGAETQQSTGSQTTETTQQNQSTRTFTLAELAQFNGKDGNPAYIAVDGVVYDLTGSSLWPSGEHTSCNLDSSAGKDLSEVIKQAPPRMRDNLKRFPVVGQLAP